MQSTETAGASRLDRSVDLLTAGHPGMTGYLLFEALWRAAERGVRVRLLLDDNDTAGLDPAIAAHDAHRNIEVRLYNPLRHRGLRLLNYVTEFARVNRRMHNESFTVDDRVTVVGGRNVGDEYFGAGGGVGFMELDVIDIGDSVPQVSAAFERYWNSASAYPATRVVGTADTAPAAALQGRFASTRVAPEAAAYLAALRDVPSVRDLLSGQISLEWSTAQLLVDDPAKTLAKEKKADLLRAGVQLFELKPTANEGKDDDVRHLPGKSAASLHAKTFAIDGQRFFVGTFDFDERSALLNTEMGPLIDSEPLAGQLGTWFDCGSAARLRSPAGRRRASPAVDRTRWQRGDAARGRARRLQAAARLGQLADMVSHRLADLTLGDPQRPARKPRSLAGAMQGVLWQIRRTSTRSWAATFCGYSMRSGVAQM